MKARPTEQPGRHDPVLMMSANGTSFPQRPAESGPPIYLMVTADDCGLSEGVNHAAAQLHELGMLATASVMANFPASRHALKTLAAYDDLEIGAHLNLSDGVPLTIRTASTDLTRSDGQFRNQFFMYAQAMFPSSAYRQMVRDELRAQLDFFEENGVRPAHITTHCHFHVLPALREIVYVLAEERGVSWVRSNDYRSTAIPFNPVLLKDNPTDQPHAFTIPDYLVSLKQWLWQTPEQMLDEILTLEGLVELVVHPGFTPDPTYPLDVRYGPAERRRETEFLRTFGALLREHSERIRIVNFRRFNGPGGADPQ